MQSRKLEEVKKPASIITSPPPPLHIDTHLHATCLQIRVTESDMSYTIVRRWRQLKALDKALRKLTSRTFIQASARLPPQTPTSSLNGMHFGETGRPGAALYGGPRLPQLPSSFFAASLEPRFLAVRAKCMVAYLEAAVTRFGASVANAAGPPELLDFLRPNRPTALHQASLMGTTSIEAVATGSATIGEITPTVSSGLLATPATAPTHPPARGAPLATDASTSGACAPPTAGGTLLPKGALMGRLLAAAAAQPCPAERDAAALRARREVSHGGCQID